MRLWERLAAAVKKLTKKRPAPSVKAAASLPQKGEGAAAPGASGETAPKAVSAKLPRGSAEKAPAAGAAMPAGTAKRPPASPGPVPEGAAKRPASTAADPPKGTAEGSPGRLRTARAGGSAQAVREGSRAAMPAGSWQSIPQTGTAGQAAAEDAVLSGLTGEIALTGPPADPARALSELLRVQRRMNPGAANFGEEVL